MLVTGSPVGGSIVQEETYLQDAPNLFIQDYRADPLNNPDPNGFYWGLSGTVLYPYMALGCVADVSLTEGLTMNDVVCDTTGYKNTIIKRNYVELNLTVKTLLPLTSVADIMKLSPVVQAGTAEYMGFGPVDNSRFFHMYMAKVYNTTVPGWVAVHLHKGRFVDAWTINFKPGQEWALSGIKYRAYFVDSYPEAQAFGVMYRDDASALP
jgi:hypothetical protein